MKIAHSERLLKAAREVVKPYPDRVLYSVPTMLVPADAFTELWQTISEIDRDQRDGQP